MLQEDQGGGRGADRGQGDGGAAADADYQECGAEHRCAGGRTDGHEHAGGARQTQLPQVHATLLPIPQTGNRHQLKLP